MTIGKFDNTKNIGKQQMINLIDNRFLRTDRFSLSTGASFPFLFLFIDTHERERERTLSIW